MKSSRKWGLLVISSYLWGDRSRFRYLLMVSCLLLLAWLGGRELWTQEHRWADIVTGMFLRQDFFHPYLGEATYYDKPLLSYWLMAIIAKLSGGLTTWALRLPSAFAGLLAVWSIYRLGVLFKGKELGMLSGWMLLTTYFFLFWARTSSADMLNLAGTLFAVTWYFEKRDSANFFEYAVFFLIIALTSLCKGLIGAVVPIIAVAADMVVEQNWRRYFQLSLAFSVIPAFIVYAAPFVISSLTSDGSYAQNGLYLVYRENILRYFHPFDHQGPIYTYLIYLPVYLLPWTFFFFPACWRAVSQWKRLSHSSRWMALTVGLLFIFLTVSGSRRSYYVLPLLPFAILMTADWLLSSVSFANRCKRFSGLIAVLMLPMMFIGLDYLPAWYNDHYGAAKFAALIKAASSNLAPLKDSNILMLDAETKLNFYLHLSPNINNYSVPGERRAVTASLMETKWPFLKKYDHKSTIILTRKQYVERLKPFFKNDRVLTLPDYTLPLIHYRIESDLAALVPSYAT